LRLAVSIAETFDTPPIRRRCDSDLPCRQTAAAIRNQHFHVPAKCLPSFHAETSEFIPPDGAKRRQVGEVHHRRGAAEAADRGATSCCGARLAGLARTANAQRETKQPARAIGDTRQE